MAAPRVLIIAYACAPSRGSEWGLSWNLVRAMAESQTVWVITHAENRRDIETHLAAVRAGEAARPAHSIHVSYVTMPDWVNWIGSLGYACFNVQYYFWQFAVARAARRLHDDVRFDVVQHLSLMRWWNTATPGSTVPGGGARSMTGTASRSPL